LALPFTNIPFTQPSHWPTAEFALFALNKDQAVFLIPLRFSIVRADCSWPSLISAILGFAEVQSVKSAKSTSYLNPVFLGRSLIG
jgi:hypothetical protein